MKGYSNFFFLVMEINLLIQIIIFSPFLFCIVFFCVVYSPPSIRSNSDSDFKIANTIFLFLFTCILILVTGLRSPYGGLSVDYTNYESIYYSFKNISWMEIALRGKGEVLFSVLYKLCGEITNYNIVSFMFVIAIMTIVPIMKYFYDNSYNPWFSIVLLVTIGSFWTSFNTSRQYLAAALYILSYKYIIKRQFFKYLIFVCFISLIHRSSIVMLPFYWLLNIRWDFVHKASKYLLLAILLFFCLLLSQKMIELLVPSYLLNTELMREKNSPIQLIRPLLSLTIIFLKFRIMNFHDGKDRFMFNSVLFYFIIFCMSLSFKIFQRWSYFLVFPTLVVIPNIIARIKFKDERLFYYGVFISFSIFYSFITLSSFEYTFFGN